MIALQFKTTEKWIGLRIRPIEIQNCALEMMQSDLSVCYDFFWNGVLAEGAILKEKIITNDMDSNAGRQR